MNIKFKKIVDKFPGLIEQLVNSPARPWSNLGSLPQKGIYVFFENKHPIYVGRTNRMKNRIKEHGRPSSTHNSAPFASNLAKKDAEEKGIDVSGFRIELEKNPNFVNLFSKAKERVSKMSVRVIEINDSIIQALFEVYVSIELNTEFNEFDTH
jgi:hypothetical protein